MKVRSTLQEENLLPLYLWRSQEFHRDFNGTVTCLIYEKFPAPEFTERESADLVPQHRLRQPRSAQLLFLHGDCFEKSIVPASFDDPILPFRTISAISRLKIALKFTDWDVVCKRGWRRRTVDFNAFENTLCILFDEHRWIFFPPLCWQILQRLLYPWTFEQLMLLLEYFSSTP